MFYWSWVFDSLSVLLYCYLCQGGYVFALICLFVWLVGWFVPWQNYSKKSYRWIFVKRLARNSQQQSCSNAWHLHIAMGNTAIRNPTVRKPLISACISRNVIRPRKTALWGKPIQLTYFDMWSALTEVYILWVHSTSLMLHCHDVLCLCCYSNGWQKTVKKSRKRLDVVVVWSDIWIKLDLFSDTLKRTLQRNQVTPLRKTSASSPLHRCQLWAFEQ